MASLTFGAFRSHRCLGVAGVLEVVGEAIYGTKVAGDFAS